MKLYITFFSLCIFISCASTTTRQAPGGYVVPQSTWGNALKDQSENSCFSCNGTGQSECFPCDRTGQRTCYLCQGSGLGSMCYNCHGAGRIYSEIFGWSKCSSCNGRGYGKCFSCGGRGLVKCMSCSGRGWNKCYSCNGRGYKN